MILAIDTATQYAGLALYDNGILLAEEIWQAGRNHTIELMPRLVRMLQTARLVVADLTAIAVSQGPGSFTGLRIGLAAAKGLALPHKLPLVGVPTLEVVAYPWQEQGLPVWAIIQAGRGRILAACYDWVDEQWQALDQPHLTNFEALASQIKRPVLCTGEIDEVAAQILQQGSRRKARLVSPAARLRRPGYLAEIAATRLQAGAQADPDSLEPIYPSPL
ncbi:MAG: tRNA (adenosine(37)-N6)-threonylcarbamoyltransferase complex dimerization subunit type 1 TsaB [Chloroflexota bacterium]